jgi:iron(III) transport system ATP-binding protein
MFGLTALGRTAREQEARAALARVGLQHLADAFPHEASGGEQQRVALARAIVPRPGILLMDEPFTGLDSRLRDSVRADTMSVLRETGATALIVTHDPEEAMRMSDRIVLMRRGRIVQQGTAEQLYNSPNSLFAARFFSQLNEVDGVVAAGRAETPIGSFAAPRWVDGQAVAVGIRPQGVRLLPATAAEGRPGRIVSRHFLGEIELFSVAIEGADTYLTAKARAGEGLQPADEVRVAFEARDILVFPAEA